LECPITSDQYFKLPHAMVSVKENPLGYLDRAFAAYDEPPNVVASAPHFFSVAAIAARTPVLVTLPTVMAAHYASAFGLTTCPIPIPLESFPVSLIWHSRLERDEGIRWLREKLRETSKGLFDPLDS
jgi:DNA-binding transcriptional LysR family regulator